MKKELRSALLGTQCALLGEVIPELRAVVVDADDKEQFFYIRIYYDGEISEDMIECLSCVVTEASTDVSPDYNLDNGIERLDYPKKIPANGIFAYLRKEAVFCGKKGGYSQEGREDFTIADALLVVQDALLGAISPALRSVVVDVNKEEHLFYIRLYYDGMVTEEEIALWNNAIEAAKKALGSKCILNGQVERLDYPHEMPFRGRYAYRRKE